MDKSSAWELEGGRASRFTSFGESRGGVGNRALSTLEGSLSGKDKRRSESSRLTKRGSGLLRVEGAYRDGNTREGKSKLLEVLENDKGGVEGLGVEKVSAPLGVECELEGDGSWSSGREENGEAKNARVFGFGGEEEEAEVEEAISENVEDREDVLELDERDRGDAIRRCFVQKQTRSPRD